MDNIFLTKVVIGVVISVLVWGIIEMLMRIMNIHDHRQRSYLYFITILSSFSSIVYAFFFFGVHINGDELLVSFPDAMGLKMALGLATIEKFRFFDFRFIFFSLIIISVFVFVFTLFFSSIYIKKMANLKKCENKKIIDVVKRVCRHKKVDPPKIMMVNGVNAFVFGFPPILAIGKDLIENVNEKELELIITHEVNHIKNYDTVLKPFLFSLRILFFFNPVVHVLSRNLTREREFLADNVSDIKKEKVLFLYSLVRLSELHCGKNNIVPSVLSFPLVKPNLKARTETLLRENKKTGMRPFFISLWVFALLIMVGMYVSTTVTPGRGPPLDTAHMPERILNFHPLDKVPDHGFGPMGGVEPLFKSQNHSFVPDQRAFFKSMPRFYHVDVTTAVTFILVIPLLVEGGYHVTTTIRR